MVVGVFMGSRPNAGFSTAVVSATAGNGALIVRYSETMPRAGHASRAQVLTFPYHLVAIPEGDGDGREVREGPQIERARFQRKRALRTSSSNF